MKQIKVASTKQECQQLFDDLKMLQRWFGWATVIGGLLWIVCMIKFLLLFI